MKKRNNAMGSYDQYRAQQIPDPDDAWWAAQERRIEQLECEAAKPFISKKKLMILGGLAITGLAFIGGMWLGKRGVED